MEPLQKNYVVFVEDRYSDNSTDILGDFDTFEEAEKCVNENLNRIDAEHYLSIAKSTPVPDEEDTFDNEIIAEYGND